MKLVLSVAVLDAVLATARRLPKVTVSDPVFQKGLALIDGVFTAATPDASFQYAVPALPADLEPIVFDRDSLAEIVDLADDNTSVTFTHGGKRASFFIAGSPAARKVTTYDAKEWSPLLIVPKAKEFSEPQIIDAEGQGDIRRALANASTDETRHIICSACLSPQDGGAVHIIGTDGRRLFASPPYFFGNIKHPIILPNLALWKCATLAKGFESWAFSYSLAPVVADPKLKKPAALEPRVARVTVGAWSFHMLIPVGNYPNWKQVIPKATRIKATIPVARGKTLAKSLFKLEHNVRVTVNGTMDISEGASGLILSAPDAVITKPEGFQGDIHASFNPKFLTDAFVGGATSIELTDDISPALLTTPTNGRFVIMPVRTE